MKIIKYTCGKTYRLKSVRNYNSKDEMIKALDVMKSNLKSNEILKVFENDKLVEMTER